MSNKQFLAQVFSTKPYYTRCRSFDTKAKLYNSTTRVFSKIPLVWI